MSPKLEPLSRGTLKTGPSVCHDCVWWQGRGGAGYMAGWDSMTMPNGLTF